MEDLFGNDLELVQPINVNFCKKDLQKRYFIFERKEDKIFVIDNNKVISTLSIVSVPKGIKTHLKNSNCKLKVLTYYNYIGGKYVYLCTEGQVTFI